VPPPLYFHIGGLPKFWPKGMIISSAFVLPGNNRQKKISRVGKVYLMLVGFY
jgi:hypothetical protein